MLLYRSFEDVVLARYTKIHQAWSECAVLRVEEHPELPDVKDSRRTENLRPELV